MDDKGSYVLIITKDAVPPPMECIGDLMRKLVRDADKVMICAGPVWEKFDPRFVLDRDCIICLVEEADGQYRVRARGGSTYTAMLKRYWKDIDFRKSRRTVAKAVYESVLLLNSEIEKEDKEKEEDA